VVTGLSINGGAATGATGSGVASGQMVGRGPGRPSAGIVRLRDVARVELGDQNYNLACRFDGHPSVGLAIFQLPGTNALDVAKRIRAKMEELKANFPEGVDYQIAYDTTPFIRESIADVVQTLLEAVALVAVVVLVFLQNWRAALIPMVAVPVAIVGTFAVMAPSASASTTSLCLVWCWRSALWWTTPSWWSRTSSAGWSGASRRKSGAQAMDEVTGPVIAVALVLCAVFVPCAFISASPASSSASSR